MATKYWLDTEFIEDGKTIDLISIGIVAEDGRELYLLNGDCDCTRASEWVKDNVLIHLPKRNFRSWAHPDEPLNGRYTSKLKLASLVKDFCDPIKYGKPEFWAYYAAYDWVVFCQLFGTMMQLPDSYPMYCMDIQQWRKQLGDPLLPKQKSGCHDALEDARHNKIMWEFLTAKSMNICH